MDIDTDEELKELLQKSRVSFQRYHYGLLLRCHYNTQVLMIPVPYNLLLKLTYTNGEISIRNRSPLRFLLWLGVSIRILKAIAPSMVTITNAGIQMDAEGIFLTLKGPGSVSTQKRFFNLVEQDRITHQNKMTSP